jgi:hypothetical protein
MAFFIIVLSFALRIKYMTTMVDKSRQADYNIIANDNYYHLDTNIYIRYLIQWDREDVQDDITECKDWRYLYGEIVGT